jgi:alpha-beta hydrolase superfamily lysophospholipase
MLQKAEDAELDQVKGSIDLAYDDLKRAFRHFLEARPDKKRPFFVAAHSQGAILMSKVIADCVEPSPEHRSRFVAAYLAGGYVPI